MHLTGLKNLTLRTNVSMQSLIIRNLPNLSQLTLLWKEKKMEELEQVTPLSLRLDLTHLKVISEKEGTYKTSLFVQKKDEKFASFSYQMKTKFYLPRTLNKQRPERLLGYQETLNSWKLLRRVSMFTGKTQRQSFKFRNQFPTTLKLSSIVRLWGKIRHLKSFETWVKQLVMLETTVWDPSCSRLSSSEKEFFSMLKLVKL